ncbi:molybdate transport system substrate-binding protein [Paenarthrobacter nitroguajacolicus]|uniref:substrate-binding domain-containing protein n=1 Tax=Paenarthrobacter nitroguajacolicus TaxID=211146 RepID=UPI0028660C40|nr:substrate-binding domain-containing protein [Paenarthrobacter nitroguajacolicus]MDR6989245.1 molybdate transport system substrate-binding protein [Paenarthrobacter nitroguajacolicus]
MKIFSTLAVKKALNDVVIDAFKQETGGTVDPVFDPTNQLLRRIHDGERFDVLIGVSDSFRTLGRIIDTKSLTPVARTGIGLAVAQGRQKPDISTTKDFIATVLGARSVAYSRTGASGIYFAGLLEKLGIAEEVNSRATILEKGFIAETLIDGRADLAVQQLSELLFVPNVQIVGPLPAELQHYTDFSAATHSQAVTSSQAQAFVAFLASPVAKRAYLETLLELPA